MKWGGGSRWRKAWIISFVLHAVVLTGAGWLVSRALLPAALPETLIELELANEPDSPPGGGGASLPDQWPASSAAPANQPQQPAALPVMQQVAQPLSQPTAAVVAVSAMALESVDTSAIVPAGASASGGSESSSGGSGSGGGTGSGSGSGAGSGAGAGAGSGSGSGRDIVRPSILSQPKPLYPEAARQAGIEGTVMLRVEVLETGRAGGVSVISSSGSDLLDEAAVEAVQRWRFVPAKVRETGQKIACTVKVPINFELSS